jgi:transposase
MKKQRQLFKPYHQNQLMALPPTFEELISPSHPVRVVNQIVDQINLDSVFNKYGGGGCSSYHPRMLLKVLIYGYLCNIYSSRKLESAICENIYFMWLSGMQQPDHNTLNRFRSERLSEVIKDVFSQVVLLMVDSGHLDLRSVYTDGTKIESSANRYTFVWGKAIKRSRARIESQLEELWNYAQTIAKEEFLDTRPSGFEATDPQAVKETIDRIDRALKGKDIDKKKRQKITYAKKHWPDAVERYNRDEQILQHRNSYSKTDPDATFMRMKEDHMRNGQLKPGYNVQISTQNQIITNYTIHQNPTDFFTLIPHLEAFKKMYGFMPEELTADAGYGSYKNYEYLKENDIIPYVKYPLFNKENKPKKTKVQNVEPLQKPTNTTATNSSNSELKDYVKSLLLSEKGISHRKKRSVDVEPVFGMIKENRGFRRFKLSGLNKVNIEFGLLALAHNLAKLTKILLLNGFFNELYSVSFFNRYRLLHFKRVS